MDLSCIISQAKLAYQSDIHLILKEEEKKKSSRLDSGKRRRKIKCYFQLVSTDLPSKLARSKKNTATATPSKTAVDSIKRSDRLWQVSDYGTHTKKNKHAFRKYFKPLHDRLQVFCRFKQIFAKLSKMPIILLFNSSFQY